ncbi:annexin-like protein RJ4 isoform X1 [Rhododendron vialii]|uniref:annexin-like protein RJ4 isoform X1 n=1 Tax=Rhododendron vialii TaxID=182163 RepID=UPI00265FE7C5|nr:annexin-like protein RJ4 isoform X1 [Rhododendron vialii]
MATLIAPEHPSPVADAEAIRNAVQGLGTNEKTIIAVIAHRNAVQRKLIRYAYEEIYQEDLVKRLESELTGEFEKAVCRWMLEPADRDAVLANVAIKQSTSVHRVITELSCIYSPEELLAVKRAYQARYKHSIEEDVAAHTSGDLRKLLVALVGTYRYDGDEVNEKLANSEAKALHHAIKEEVIDQDEIIRILSLRSKAQLMATFNRYKFDYGTSITKHLVDDPANQYLAAVHTALQCINNPKKYYEKVLRSALNKPWTDEDVLTRVIVTRAEKDLREIKDLYYKRTRESLDHAVAKDTSGDYKAFLLTLLGNQD